MKMNAKQRSAADHFAEKVNSINELLNDPSSASQQDLKKWDAVVDDLTTLAEVDYANCNTDAQKIAVIAVLTAALDLRTRLRGTSSKPGSSGLVLPELAIEAQLIERTILSQGLGCASEIVSGILEGLDRKVDPSVAARQKLPPFAKKCALWWCPIIVGMSDSLSYGRIGVNELACESGPGIAWPRADTGLWAFVIFLKNDYCGAHQIITSPDSRRRPLWPS